MDKKKIIKAPTTRRRKCGFCTESFSSTCQRKVHWITVHEKIQEEISQKSWAMRDFDPVRDAELKDGILRWNAIHCRKFREAVPVDKPKETAEDFLNEFMCDIGFEESQSYSTQDALWNPQCETGRTNMIK